MYLGQEPCKHRVYCVALDLSAEFGILRQNEPMVVVTTVVSLMLYYLGPGAGARGEREPRCHRTVTGSVQKGTRCAI